MMPGGRNGRSARASGRTPGRAADRRLVQSAASSGARGLRIEITDPIEPSFRRPETMSRSSRSAEIGNAAGTLPALVGRDNDLIVGAGSAPVREMRPKYPR